MRAAARRTACRASTSRRCTTPTAAARFTALGLANLCNYWSSTYQSACTETDRAGERQWCQQQRLRLCQLHGRQPVPAAITTLNRSGHRCGYDGSDVHAVKVKRAIPYTTQGDGEGRQRQPVPEAPFVLTRGDGYVARGESIPPGR